MSKKKKRHKLTNPVICKKCKVGFRGSIDPDNKLFCSTRCKVSSVELIPRLNAFAPFKEQSLEEALPTDHTITTADWLRANIAANKKARRDQPTLKQTPQSQQHAQQIEINKLREQVLYLEREKLKLTEQVLKKKEPAPNKERDRKKRRNAFYLSQEWRELRYKVIKKQGRKCGACRATEGTMHVDHIKPRSKYPHLELEESNLQILCENCNMGKGNKDEIDWRKPFQKGVR
jgi:5-methylcytosine-specific restriction endonuclease McrA